MYADDSKVIAEVGDTNESSLQSDIKEINEEKQSDEQLLHIERTDTVWLEKTEVEKD